MSKTQKTNLKCLGLLSMKKLRAIYYILFSKTFYYFTVDKKEYYTQDSNQLQISHANEIICNLSSAISEELTQQAQEETLNQFKQFLN